MLTLISILSCLAIVGYKVYLYWFQNEPTDLIGDFLIIIACSCIIALTAEKECNKSKEENDEFY